MDKLSIRDEISLILGFKIPESSLDWEPMIKETSVSGMVDQNKKFNLTIMLLMRVADIEKRLEALESPQS